nr:uncharacterized protein LOC106840247 isoform X2 [Equus asinus]
MLSLSVATAERHPPAFSLRNWRGFHRKHRHYSHCTKPWERVYPYLKFRQSVDIPSPGDRRPCPLAYPSSNSKAFNPTQQEMLVLQTQPENSRPGVQESEAQEEIAPGDIKYRLELFPKAPLPMQSPSYFSQQCKPQWLPFSTTYGECYKSWKMEPVTYHREKSSYSGDEHMSSTHQISFHNPPLGQLMFPVHIQGRKIAPTVHPGYMESIGQYQSDFQAPGWSEVLRPGPDRNSQGINKYIYTMQKDTAPSQPPTVHQHQKPSWPTQQMAILGGKSTAKFDENTVTRVKRVKGKFPSSILRVFKAKFQTEITSKQFSQDCGTQPQVHYGDPHYRGYEKPLIRTPAVGRGHPLDAPFTSHLATKGMGSQAPAKDQTTTRTPYMPLFSEKVNLCKPKVNSIKCEANNLSTEQRKTFRPVQLPKSSAPAVFIPTTRLKT